jgi:nitrile hydratase
MPTTGGHDHPHDDHERTVQPDEEDSLGYYAIAEMAVRELLIERGVFTADEFRRQLEAADRGSEALGAKVVARAWTDPDFKALLLRDGSAAVAEYDVEMLGHTRLYAVENTPEVHNVIVCTLCSCYPKPLLGRPPDWYKSRNYRARMAREPRQVLAEFGTVLPDGITVRVHDSNADMRYIVLPSRPAGTEGYSAEQLEALVTRDAMVGVTVVKPPA